MAVYQPDIPRLRAQVASILSQADVRIRVFVCVDGPMQQLPEIERMTEEDERLFLVAFEEWRGAADTFLSGLEHVLKVAPSPDERCFAFADQDDLWFSNKLVSSVAELRAQGVSAVHTDAQVMKSDGTVIAQSVFSFEGRDLEPGVKRLFFRNNATGMTMVLRESLARALLALHDLRPRGWMHDHFAAFLAQAGAGLWAMRTPTASYIQHEDNTIGALERPARLGASGNLRKDGGTTDRYLREGAQLIEHLLEAEWVSPASRNELVELYGILTRRGIAEALGCLDELAELTRNRRPLLARLLWVKLTSHQWPDTQRGR